MLTSPDLTTCEKEPIQWPGFIQSCGYLLALDPATFAIWQASENIVQLTGRPVDTIIGESIITISLADVPGSLLYDLLVVAKRSGTSAMLNPYPLKLHGQDWLVIIHEHDSALIVELEPTGQSYDGAVQPLNSLMTQAMTDIQRSTTLNQLLERTARQIKKITGFDRVMIYRFGEDWHGEVVAEAREEHLVPFLGLHYPASDIPRQARELYKINLVRGIADVNEAPVPIVPINNSRYNRPLDLTHANLRSVSPIHVEYLRNMGVRASLSISLLYGTELWGLIACHHYQASRFIDYQARQSIRLVSQLLSTVLVIRKEEEDAGVSNRLHQAEQTLARQMLADWDVVQGLTKHPLTALDINEATGAALLFEDTLHLLGNTPTADEIRSLIDWLKNTTPESVFQTNQLPNLYAPAVTYRDKAAGVLMLVLSRQMNEYLLWFKPEQIQEVSWGGNPDKPMERSEDGELILSPRKSFDKWIQLVRNKSESWQQIEVAMALKLREDLLQIVAGKANQIRALNEQLRQTTEELEAFSYTISHDLRSPLASIKRYTEIYKEDYGAQMDEPARAIFDRIIKASERMSMLIRNIMQYSQVGSSGFTPKWLSMRDMLVQLRDESLIGEPGRDITIQLGETPDLQGDQTMVNQVFSNLFSNALKYTRTVPNARITVNGYQNEQEVIYAVTDNGIGIDMKQAGKVFELFQRLDSAASYEGYGVGLAIVKRIVSRHQGKVWFESIPYQATTFYVSFPKRTT